MGRVGLAGLGNLGMPMARRLIDRGWPLLAFDVRSDRAAECARHGAVVADSVDDIADCDIVALVVPDDAAVSALLDDGSLLDRLPAGRLVVVHSTVLPATAERLGDRASGRGLHFVDGPVSGGAERARKGALTLMAGASEESIEHARAYLDAVADTVVHVGPPGAGAATKLANQLMMFAALAGTYEAIELARAYGVSEASVLEAVKTSTGDSWVAREWGFFDRVAAAYDNGDVPIHQRPWSKDLWEIVAAARSARLSLPVAGLLSQTLPDTVESHGRSGGAPA